MMERFVERNGDFITGALIILLFGFMGAALLCTTASAIQTEITPAPVPTFISVNETTHAELLSHTYEIHRINQGDKVYLGDHIDFSGVVAGNDAIAWFAGGEPDPGAAPTVINLPDTKAGYYNFYVDPAIFTEHLGYWYKWNGYFESNGNTRAFWVAAAYRNTTDTAINGSVTNSSTLINGQYANVTLPEEEILPAKNIADILAVKGQPIVVNSGEQAKVWVFGRIDSLYDVVSLENKTVLSPQMVEGLETGTYTVITQYPGHNTIPEVLYNADNNQFESPWAKVKPVELNGLSPMLALDKFMTMVTTTDDPINKKTLVLQEPSLDISSMEQMSTYAAKGYYRDSNLRGNVTVFEVKGYTNVQAGTNLYFALDKDQQPRKVKWFNTTAQGKVVGDMRTFRVYIPVYWDNMQEGMHTISGYTNVGGSIYRDFPVRIMPADSFIPDETIKWIGNQNPWAPNLTPNDVVIQTKIVEKIIQVEVTPSPEAVYAAQKKVAEERDAANTAAMIGNTLIVITLLIVAVLLRWLYRMYRKAKE